MNEHSFQTQAQVQQVNSNSDQFGFALFLAIAVHALIIFGIGFTLSLSDAPPPTLEVTLSLHQSELEPEHADYQALHNQQGSGDKAEKSQISTDRMAEIPAPTIHETNPVSTSQQQRKRSEPTALLTTVSRNHRQAPAAEQAERDVGELSENIDSTTLQALSSLNAEYDRDNVELSKSDRKSKLTAVATSGSAEAGYINNWETQVLKNSSANYPGVINRLKLYGTLRLKVTILPDGKVENVSILTSSGKKLLDATAVRFVWQSGPFDPFPRELQDREKLEISRTFEFFPGNQIKTGK